MFSPRSALQTSHHPLKISVDTKGADATPTAPPSPLYVATHALFMAARGAEVSSPAETNFEHVETVTLSALLNFVCAHCKHMDREAISRGMRALLSLSLTPADARSGDTDCLSLSLPQLFARVQVIFPSYNKNNHNNNNNNFTHNNYIIIMTVVVLVI